MVRDTLNRIMWRLRENVRKTPGNARETAKITPKDLQKAIILEAGYDERTYERIKKALINIGWIKSTKQKTYVLTGADLNGNY